MYDTNVHEDVTQLIIIGDIKLFEAVAVNYSVYY
jgi:hypothetical protein